MPEQPLVLVGEVIKPHGLAGEFSVKVHVDSPDFFAHVPCLYLRRTPGDRPRPVAVTSWRMHNARLLLRLDQVQGRDEVEQVRGAELLARPEDLPNRSDEDIYIHELIGMRVLLPSGKLLGRIESVNSSAGSGVGQEIWSIRTESGQEVLFPAHQDFVLEADRTTATVRIDPPPGLLELYLGEEG
ncbi:ribosome maturation factor RimM [Desulfonatronum sp. SC1]|uniref:ribosome maturation factor RimM n=1 Tax=Desulfonatronum sp. SC1 TaxID=2109626 RepID=UPI000D3127B3|nr:ribosome maturation factor RimM [Desulfonatronum sp. SC1]PTN37996.1 16S rRNA processing protein RimM [Desulfonatronum sp. SC1]